MSGEVQVAPLPKRRLPEAAELMHAVLRYGPLETPPAWLMYTSALHGGVALGALAGGRLVGFLFASPARVADGWCLYMGAIAVAPSHRSQGIAGRLMDAARAGAAGLGYREMRWTTGLLNTRAHLLYLGHCGATLVAHRPDLYAHLLASLGDRPGAADELEFRWPASARARGPAEDASAEPVLVELPWDPDSLDAARAAEWRVELRAAVRELLSRGYCGQDAIVDRAGSRAFIVFRRSHGRGVRARLAGPPRRLRG